MLRYGNLYWSGLILEIKNSTFEYFGSIFYQDFPNPNEFERSHINVTYIMLANLY